jgi:hypothetical protein
MFRLSEFQNLWITLFDSDLFWVATRDMAKKQNGETLKQSSDPTFFFIFYSKKMLIKMTKKVKRTIRTT